MLGSAKAVAAAKQSIVGPHVHIFRVGPMIALRMNPAIQNVDEAIGMDLKGKVTSLLFQTGLQEWF